MLGKAGQGILCVMLNKIKQGSLPNYYLTAPRESVYIWGVDIVLTNTIHTFFLWNRD